VARNTLLFVVITIDNRAGGRRAANDNANTTTRRVTMDMTNGTTKTETKAHTGEAAAADAAPALATTHRGSCHCGAVRFEAELDPSAGGARCNCTICTKIAQVGAIVKPSAFRLLAGEESLSTYEWGLKTSRRFFCKHCGVHAFGRGHLKELGGDYVSINLNALDDIDVGTVALSYWDGRHNNWYAGTRPTPWPIGEAPRV
jgi:hypothetical protein